VLSYFIRIRAFKIGPVNMFYVQDALWTFCRAFFVCAGEKHSPQFLN
jgi:hypothetical protein